MAVCRWDDPSSSSAQIWVINLNTKARKQLTNNSTYDSEDPLFVGNQIVYVSRRAAASDESGDFRELWVMNADGSNPTMITNNTFADVFSESVMD